MLKKIIKVSILFFAIISSQNLFSCSSTPIKKLIFPNPNGGVNIQEIVKTEKDILCPIEIKEWQEHVNLYPANSIMMDTMLGKKNELIYRAKYTFDNWGFRKMQGNNVNAPSHIILAGDSNTFGIGLNDDQTIAFNLARKNKNFYVYNMGIPATGPSNYLYFLENYSLKKINLENHKNGIMIYTFFDFLVERVIGSKNFMVWGEKFPRYEVGNNGIIYYAGTFENRYQTRFYKFLNKYDFLKALIPNLPRITHDDLVLTAKVLAKIRDEYLKQTSIKNKFLVVVRDDRQHEKFLEMLVEELHKEKIDVISVKGKLNNQITEIKGDAHMDANGASVYAQFLFDHLLNRMHK